jgi:hypothetical protein
MSWLSVAILVFGANCHPAKAAVSMQTINTIFFKVSFMA